MDSGTIFGQPASTNPRSLAFVEKYRELCEPDRVFWCDGSEAEKAHLTAEAVASGVLIELNQEKLPGCYYHRSNPNDVARVEQCTFICTPSKKEAGPTNNWTAPREMYTKLHVLLAGAMRGRTMYVIPYLMGPPGSPLTKVGVEITDSIYVVLNMRIMSRMGKVALDQLGDSDDFNRGVHSTLDLPPGPPLHRHFPQDNAIISVGSGYGGNVLLGKKCLALRIGSYLGRDQGWMAEHMLILCVESPTGEKTYVAAAFPSACGKTNFAMLIPPESFAGWKITTIGDDIAWMKPGAERQALRDQSGGRLFRRRAGHELQIEPERDGDDRARHHLHECRADAGWRRLVGGEGRGAAEGLIDWLGKPWDPASGEKAAHPNSRFTSPMANNPVLAPEANDPKGVPISAHHFRRPARDDHAAHFPVVQLDPRRLSRRDDGERDDRRRRGRGGQSAPRPDGDAPVLRLQHGRLSEPLARHPARSRRPAAHLPRELVSQGARRVSLARFRGEFPRPEVDHRPRAAGAPPRARRRSAGCRATASSTGRGLDFSRENFDACMKIDAPEWQRELISQTELFLTLHDRLPKELIFQRELLISRL